jgi:branched-chain amino acid transport system substrate-binding protein
MQPDAAIEVVLREGMVFHYPGHLAVTVRMAMDPPADHQPAFLGLLLGIQQPFLGGDTWEAPEFIQIGGSAVEGTAFSTHYSKDAAAVTDMSKTFIEKYKAEYNKDPNAFAALGFDAYMVILDAITRANSVDSVKIRDALAATKNFQGATGVITLDENRNATKSAVILEVNKGAFKYLTTVNP